LAFLFFFDADDGPDVRHRFYDTSSARETHSAGRAAGREGLLMSIEYSNKEVDP